MVDLILNTANISGGDEYMDRQDLMDAFNSVETHLENMLNGTQQFDGLLGGAGSLDASALMELISTSKGVLFPRMTTVQRDAIGTPANGLIIYNNDQNRFNFYDGSGWTILPSGVLLDDIAALTGMTKGDLLAYDGSNLVRVSVGTDGEALIADSAQASGLNWAASGLPDISVLGLMTATQSITSGATTIVNWDSEGYDTDGIHDTVTNNDEFVIQTAGKYSVLVSLNIPANVTGTRTLRILINSTNAATVRIDADSVSDGVQIMWEGALAVNDILQLQITQNSGSAMNVGGPDNTFFSVRLVG